MAKLEAAEDTKKRAEEKGAADLLIAIASPVNAAELKTAATEAVLGAPANERAGVSLANLHIAVAYPAVGGMQESSSETMARDGASGGELRFLPYAFSGTPPVLPWLGLSATYQSIFGMARELGVGACAAVASDLAALKADSLLPLLAPVLSQRCDLALPVYPTGKFEGLLNSSILAPLSRALYGRRVLFPLAQDFSISAPLLAELEQPPQRIQPQGRTLFWPATEAALRDRKICQVHVGLHHPAPDGVDLSTVLTQTVGPLFAEMEANAPLWQRVRGSHPAETSGSAHIQPADSGPVDVRSMVETFALGFRNLQEVWGLVLPPVTLLELKRLSRMEADGFHMPDELWVRIVYDFALAYRLRTLSRVHLLGALTPLYLGWSASHVLEISNMGQYEAEQRVEKLARAYEEGKPYLLSRWRWPDRFNP